MSAMNRYLAGVLSVIAAGVMVIAYTLVFPRSTAMTLSPFTAQASVGAAASGMPGAMPNVLMAPAALPVGLVQDAVAYAPASGGHYLVTAPNGERWVSSAPTGYQVTPVVAQPVNQVRDVERVRTVEVEREPRGVVVEREPRRVIVERAPRRDWKKTAMLIGGTTAASAGLGGIFGGKKGALIGAAIGGGASTIYETTKR